MLVWYHIALRIGVPVVPGTPGPVSAYTDAHAFIDEYGFPGTSEARLFEKLNNINDVIFVR